MCVGLGQQYRETLEPPNLYLLKTTLLCCFLSKDFSSWRAPKKLGGGHIHPHRPRTTYFGEVSLHT